eukprot:gb/GECG01009449.1/.p1 GENE.gb/GECG01009449.1/~~gb/GECG01009449.1/.p1  ORF type:complete len:474 (+),score=63.20 gb/GECG01009449.1/:1-1422(+)
MPSCLCVGSRSCEVESSHGAVEGRDLSLARGVSIESTDSHVHAQQEGHTPTSGKSSKLYSSAVSIHSKKHRRHSQRRGKSSSKAETKASSDTHNDSSTLSTPYNGTSDDQASYLHAKEAYTEGDTVKRGLETKSSSSSTSEAQGSVATNPVYHSHETNTPPRAFNERIHVDHSNGSMSSTEGKEEATYTSPAKAWLAEATRTKQREHHSDDADGGGGGDIGSHKKMESSSASACESKLPSPTEGGASGNSYQNGHAADTRWNRWKDRIGPPNTPREVAVISSFHEKERIERGRQENRLVLLHEKQKLQLCGLHAVNSMVQFDYEPASKNELDGIAKGFGKETETSFLKSFFKGVHSSMWGTGNYDVNVLMVALDRRGLDVRWHDSRLPITQAAGIENCIGFLVNEALVDSAGRETSTHWYTIRKVEGYYYDLDSSFERPKRYKSFNSCMRHLSRVLEEGGHILLVEPKSLEFT